MRPELDQNVELATAVLSAELGAIVPLFDVCDRFWGLSQDVASERAAACSLPVAAFKLGSQKSPWFVWVGDLARHIVLRHCDAVDAWATVHVSRATGSPGEVD